MAELGERIAEPAAQILAATYELLVRRRGRGERRAGAPPAERRASC
jgi:hypothetical protein